MTALVFLAGVFISGCAHPIAPGTTQGADSSLNRLWTGRISLQVDSDPPQAFFAAFELTGQAEQGELKLTNPLGGVIGVMRWAPGDAVLESSGTIRHFASVEALTEKTTGAALPMAALFDWLEGKDAALAGWTADLSAWPSGKIAATRIEPAPKTQLRLLLDQ